VPTQWEQLQRPDFFALIRLDIDGLVCGLPTHRPGLSTKNLKSNSP
jgi:hypothetical protein